MSTYWFRYMDKHDRKSSTRV